MLYPLYYQSPGERVAHGIGVDVFAGHLHLLLLQRQLVVVPHLESVAEPPAGEEPVRGEEAEHRDDQVEALAEDESEVVDVVLVVDVVAEELPTYHIVTLALIDVC